MTTMGYFMGYSSDFVVYGLHLIDILKMSTIGQAVIKLISNLHNKFSKNVDNMSPWTVHGSHA